MRYADTCKFNYFVQTLTNERFLKLFEVEECINKRLMEGRNTPSAKARMALSQFAKKITPFCLRLRLKIEFDSIFEFVYVSYVLKLQQNGCTVLSKRNVVRSMLR